MIRWMLLMFILLVLVNSATGWVRKVGLGRLPGDFTFRLLGREGTMRVTVVTGADEFDKVKDKVPALLDGFRFNPGRTYAEYREGDKLAEYGLMAFLGAGALGVGVTLFGKFGKIIFAGIAATAVGAFSFVRRLFGRGKKAKTDTEDRINKLKE